MAARSSPESQPLLLMMVRPGTMFPASSVRSGYLAAAGSHEIYWEDVGNPAGRPFLFLHGGPGGGSSPEFLRIFDLRIHRVIMFDQRGAGKSRPIAGLQDNTTEHLLDDMDRLTSFFRIDRFFLAGSSWGAALALEYAKRRPEAILGILLHGLFLGRRRDIADFLYRSRSIFPSAWMQFAAHLPEEDRRNLLEAYHRRLISKDKGRALAAAISWARYEALIGQYPRVRHEEIAIGRSAALAVALISSHYFLHGCFLPEDGVLNRLEALAEVPVLLVHGEQDLVCEAEAAQRAVLSLPRGSARIIAGEGHFPRGETYWAELTKGVRDLVAST